MIWIWPIRVRCFMARVIISFKEGKYCMPEEKMMRSYFLSGNILSRISPRINSEFCFQPKTRLAWSMDFGKMSVPVTVPEVMEASLLHNHPLPQPISSTVNTPPFSSRYRINFLQVRFLVCHSWKWGWERGTTGSLATSSSA